MVKRRKFGVLMDFLEIRMTISYQNILYRYPPNEYVPFDSASFGRRFTFYAMKKRKTIAYIDGFNLFHAINELSRPELKWVNLWSLSESLLREEEELIEVNYFSAYANMDACEILKAS